MGIKPAVHANLRTMTEQTPNLKTRMLLSHNCTLPDGTVLSLSREDFAQVFIKGMQSSSDIQCSLIENPHWIVELVFSSAHHSPTEVANHCAQQLASFRTADTTHQASNQHTVMLLGGVKTTPAAGSSPTSLQQGEWGVDVVETLNPEAFLQGMNWDGAIATKAPDQVFKVTAAVQAS